MGYKVLPIQFTFFEADRLIKLDNCDVVVETVGKVVRLVRNLQDRSEVQV